MLVVIVTKVNIYVNLEMSSVYVYYFKNAKDDKNNS